MKNVSPSVKVERQHCLYEEASPVSLRFFAAPTKPERVRIDY